MTKRFFLQIECMVHVVFSIEEKVLKKIGGSMEGSSVNMMVKVPS
jgi:hypothetical protein